MIRTHTLVSAAGCSGKLRVEVSGSGPICGDSGCDFEVRQAKARPVCLWTGWLIPQLCAIGQRFETEMPTVCFTCGEVVASLLQSAVEAKTSVAESGTESGQEPERIPSISHLSKTRSSPGERLRPESSM